LKPDFTSYTEVQIAYDLSKLRALQEDRRALFTRLDNAVRSGWVMPKEARAEVGLPPVSGGDQPLPRPALTRAAPVKERVISFKAGELTADSLQALVDIGVPHLTDELDRYFNGQRRRVVRSLTRPTDSLPDGA